jgi:ribonuclease PH
LIAAPGSPTVGEVVTGSVAAVSVGLLDGVELLDLEYWEDRDAEVDFNIVMTGAGQFVEVQGAGEESTFSRAQLDRLISLGEVGIHQVSVAQKAALGDRWAW